VADSGRIFHFLHNKAKWVASLDPEQKRLLQLEIDTLDVSWLAYLKDDITSKEFLELKQFLDREKIQGKKVFPPPEDIYSWYVVISLILWIPSCSPNPAIIVPLHCNK